MDTDANVWMQKAGGLFTRGIGTAAAPRAPRRKATWFVSSRLSSSAIPCTGMHPMIQSAEVQLHFAVLAKGSGRDADRLGRQAKLNVNVVQVPAKCR